MEQGVGAQHAAPLPDIQRVRYRATVAYDGARYNGFQRQATGISTVQLALEEAIAEVTSMTVTVVGAGRTDTGVHAAGQVIAFDVGWKHSTDALLNAINAVLPDDIALQDLAIVQQATLGEVAGNTGFHPRFDATARVYKYTVYPSAQPNPLLRGRVWHVRAALDLDAMRRAGSLLVGVHDFAAFGKPTQGEITVRRLVRSEWIEDTPLLVYTVEANAFLKHMVRRMVGALVAVGRGSLTVDEFEAIFRSRKISWGIKLAPPQGLVLEQVKYAGEAEAPQVIG
jgi:tRNA pseudouridine38-40 synthase